MKKLYLISAGTILSILLSSGNTWAQLNGWSFKDRIQIYNPGTVKLNYQVLLYINTQTLVAAGKLQAGGEDLRFSGDCIGNDLLDYWIESNMNTSKTMIWVKVDSLPASDSLIIYMHYGNNTATAVSDFEATFPNRKIITGAEIISDSVWNYDYVELSMLSKGILSNDHNGRFVINARKIIINDSLIGIGSGYAGGTNGVGSGPGGGGQSIGTATSGGGGGGYGGMGGKGGGANSGVGGITNGSAADTLIDKGSGGGKGLGTPGGNGGACFELNGTDLQIEGTIVANGADGVPGWYTGGGGSGGGILIKGYRVNFAGNLSAVGGNGGVCAGNTNGGGGGGGGRVKIFYHDFLNNTGTTNVAGGIHQSLGALAKPGLDGTSYAGAFISDVPTYKLLPHVTLVASGNPVCEGTPVTFTSSTTGFKSFDFYVNTGPAQSGISNTYTTAALANGSIVKVLAKDANGCIDTSNTVLMDIKPSPVIGIATSTDSICLGETLVLSASGGANYSWSTGETTPSVSVSPGSTTSYTVTGNSTNGCTGEAEITVVVSTPVTASITCVTSSISGNPVLCPGDSAVLTAEGGTHFAWNTGDTTAALSVTPASTTTYSVVVRDGACYDIEEIIVTVIPVSAQISGTSSLCRGDSTLLIASGGTSFSWNTGDTTASIAVAPDTTTHYSVVVGESGCTAENEISVSVSTPITASITGNNSFCPGGRDTLIATGGSYYQWSTGETSPVIVVSPIVTTSYSVTAEDGACTSVAQATVTVFPEVNAEVSPDVTVCLNKSAQLKASGGTTYKWTPSTGLNSPNIKNPVATPLVATTYTVVVSNANGCSDTADVTVTVDPCTGIDEITDTDVTVFPNPSAGFLVIDIKHQPGENNKVEFINAQGEIFLEKELSKQDPGNKYRLDISSFPKGMYCLRIILADKTVIVKNIIVL